uniref:F-box associated domain-containing protein n=1 Tax=Arundo donax TaxID=35708 RepID=A0A0A9GUH2_ARUDO
MCFLWYTVLQNGQGANQWHSEAIIPLPLNYRYDIIGVAGGYLLLLGTPADKYLLPLRERSNLDWFSLNLETFQLEWFCGTEDDNDIHLARLYAGFPPPLSPPTI